MRRVSGKILIGYYSKSVFLTYLGVVSGLIGMYFAFNHKIAYALICLVISGICDAFDGRVARKCKRSSEEKSFGIQIDSLADMVSFVFLPITIFYGLGFSMWYNIVCFVIFTLGAVIRLGYFNVIAEEGFKDKAVSYYSGLPVTTSAIVFPFVYVVSNFVSLEVFQIIYSILIFLVGVLFVLNIKIKKPTQGVIYSFVICGLLLSVLLFCI